MIYSFGERCLETLGDFYVAPSADVIGSVRLGHEASIWFNAVVRGDNDWIEIGAGTNVQDLSLIHTDPGTPTRIGSGVTLGHRVLVHNCTIEDACLIGNGAIVLDHAQIGHHCVIAAGTLVPPGTVIPPHSVVMGAPGRVVRQCRPADLELIAHAAAAYVEEMRRYPGSLRSDPRG